MLKAAAEFSGAAWLGDKLYHAAKKDVEKAEDGLKDLSAVFHHNSLRRGVVAPQRWTAAGRVPFHSNYKPWGVYIPGERDKEASASRIIQHYTDVSEHDSKLVLQQFRESNPSMPWKTGGGIPTAFTRELHMPGNPAAKSNLMDTQYLPRNATPTDVYRSTMMSRAYPKDHKLGADSIFWAQPGTNWRHGEGNY